MIRVNNQKGMSLVEILVVLAIIGVIGTTIASNVIGRNKKAKYDTAKIQISKIANAINEFYSDCDQVPESLDQLIDQPSENVCEFWGLGGAYVKKQDLVDPWKQEFIYEVKGSDFVITSYGADKSQGGEGLGKDISSEDL